MKIRVSVSGRRGTQAGFSLVEATVAMGVIGTVVVALFSAFTGGFMNVQMGRENLRATQIMLEKMETIRLYSWDQINTPNFIPPTFTASYDPNSTNSPGLVYSGQVILTTAPINSSYSNDMKQVTVQLNWKTGNLDRTRQFTTYICRDGLQNYIY
jgi:Tfp pilus assembly protein PilV